MYCGKRDIAIPPGRTIKEILHDRHISRKCFACHMGISEIEACRLLNGKTEITGLIAVLLQDVFGVPYIFWQNLESNYREKLNRKI